MTPRCESRVGGDGPDRLAYCNERSTHLVSRIDAIRDHRYACEHHAGQIVQTSASEATDLRRPLGRLFSIEGILMMWPPKHRAASRADARALVAPITESEQRLLDGNR